MPRTPLTAICFRKTHIGCTGTTVQREACSCACHKAKTPVAREPLKRLDITPGKWQVGGRLQSDTGVFANALDPMGRPYSVLVASTGGFSTNAVDADLVRNRQVNDARVIAELPDLYDLAISLVEENSDSFGGCGYCDKLMHEDHATWCKVSKAAAILERLG